MKTLAESMQMMGGIFIWIQVIILILILSIAIQKFILYFGKKGPSVMPFLRSHQFILFLGIFSFVWGTFTQLLGIVQALNAIIEAADVSPQLLLNGIRNSFKSPLFGLGTMLLAAIFWAVLQAKYSAELKGRT